MDDWRLVMEVSLSTEEATQHKAGSAMAKACDVSDVSEVPAAKHQEQAEEVMSAPGFAAMLLLLLYYYSKVLPRPPRTFFTSCCYCELGDNEFACHYCTHECCYECALSSAWHIACPHCAHMLPDPIDMGVFYLTIE